ncbi:VOC family protein [Williamsia deligens]|uniref:VOC family protein n=1 Tax=Williamsia deligens TaxID=321325 RepID=A0ABW3G3V0_9NOCA|nr:VOC family protein [Williamsia deligens]MCP2193935.1 PhnB protein [Williamsia deligens]
MTTTENTAPASGDHTTDGRPHVYSSLTPFVVVTPAADAIAFYRDVFGAEVAGVTEIGGTVAHAELQFADGRLQLGEPNDAYDLAAPAGGAPVVYSLAIYVTDVDATVERAAQHGATVREPAMTFVSGDRFASILDPFGVRWSVMTRVKDLSPQESDRRVAEWAATQG